MSISYTKLRSGGPVKRFRVNYRWRDAANRLNDTIETIEATSLRRAREIAKAHEGSDRRTWLLSVEPERAP